MRITMTACWVMMTALASTLGCAANQTEADDEGEGGGAGLALGGQGSKSASGGSSGSGGSKATSGSGGQTSGCSGDSDSDDTTEPSGTAEQCGNGLDDDLNGFVDEGCSCTIGATQACYGGPPSKAGAGACIKGTQTCTGSEFGQWGPCEGWVAPSLEVCEGSVDDDCDGKTDEACGCCDGQTQPCGMQFGACAQSQGTQTCVGGKWGECTGGTSSEDEICENQIDDDCDGQTDEGCKLQVTVNIDGDCVTAFCPPQAPHAVGCQIYMSGGDERGCIANNGGPVVYFQEGNDCGAGHVSGTLTCSSEPGAPLTPSTCAINKTYKFYAIDPGGCPDT